MRIETECGAMPRSDCRRPPLVICILMAVAAAAAAMPACLRAPATQSASRHELTIGVALPRGNESRGLNALTNGLRAETLVTLAPDGRPEPRLAASWIRSADGLTWTFALAPYIYFQDGRRATAQLLSPLLQAAISDPRNRGQRPNLAEVVSVSAPDESTIVIRTRVPRVLLLDQLSDLTIPAKATDGALGAFVRESEQGDMVSFRAFDRYYRGRPGVDRVTFRSYRSLRAAWAAMMRGETDATFEVGRDAGEFVQAESGVRVYSMTRPFSAEVIFNVQRPALRPAAVRRALSSMIDRDEILRTAYRGSGVIADGPLWPFHWAIAARQRSPAAQSTGVPPGGGNRFRFTCLVAPEIAPWERVSLIIQKQFYEHGVDVQLEALSLQQMADRLERGDFDAVLVESLGRTPNWVYSFWHSPVAGAPPAFNTGYHSADEPLDRLLASENDEQVRVALSDVYRVMDDDPPAIFIAWPQVSRAIRREFSTPLGAGRDVLASSTLWMLRSAGTAQ